MLLEKEASLEKRMSFAQKFNHENDSSKGSSGFKQYINQLIFI